MTSDKFAPNGGVENLPETIVHTGVLPARHRPAACVLGHDAEQVPRPAVPAQPSSKEQYFPLASVVHHNRAVARGHSNGPARRWTQLLCRRGRRAQLLRAAEVLD
eukprot:1156901-Pelagomonas_calceolata.AAC.5